MGNSMKMLLQSGRITADKLEKMGKTSSSLRKRQKKAILHVEKAVSGQCKVRKGNITGEALAKRLKISALSRDFVLNVMGDRNG